MIKVEHLKAKQEQGFIAQRSAPSANSLLPATIWR